MRIVVDIMPTEPIKCLFSIEDATDKNVVNCRIDSKICEMCFHANRCSKLVLLDNIN